LIHYTQRVAQALLLNNEIGSEAHRKKNKDKVNGSKNHKNLKGKIRFKGGSSEK
jgi:hypothetical protein